MRRPFKEKVKKVSNKKKKLGKPSFLIILSISWFLLVSNIFLFFLNPHIHLMIENHLHRILILQCISIQKYRFEIQKIYKDLKKNKCCVMTDRQTDQPNGQSTNRRMEKHGHREVSLPITELKMRHFKVTPINYSK